jgi:hypothetical protein
MGETMRAAYHGAKLIERTEPVNIHGAHERQSRAPGLFPTVGIHHLFGPPEYFPHEVGLRLFEPLQEIEIFRIGVMIEPLRAAVVRTSLTAEPVMALYGAVSLVQRRVYGSKSLENIPRRHDVL